MNMINENKFKKALIMTIGTGSTGVDIAHGLFFSIKDSNPNLLILIGSTKSFETTWPHLKNLIVKEDIQLEFVEKLIEEVNDLETLHFEYSEIITGLLKQGYSLNKISVDYTSGTKAMSAALVSAAIETKIGSLSYVYGDRGEGGRVRTGTERRNSLSPNKFYSNNMLLKAFELFNNYRYTSCIELLTTHEFHPDYQNKADLLHRLAKMFDMWDKFNFGFAFEISRNISLVELKELNLKGKFETDYLPLLAKLKEKNISVEKVFDLIENANRRASEGKFDDAVARLYRALEMLGQIEFEKEFKCNTDDVILENLPESIKETIKYKYKSHSNKRIQLPLFKTFDVLLAVKNPIALLFEKNNVEIKKHINKRNHSILAHGSLPVAKEHYEEFFSFLTKEFSLGPNSSFYEKFSFPRITSNK